MGMVANALALALPIPSTHVAAFPTLSAASFGGADRAFSRKRSHRHISRPSLQLLATPSGASAIHETHTTSSSPTSGGSTNGTDRPWQFHVAPMQGYTSYPLRKLFHYLSRDQEEDTGGIVLWTEMEKCEHLLGTNQNGWEKRFGSPGGGGGKLPISCILQLGGSDPDLVEQCIYRAAEYGYMPGDFCGINLNCGCPSIEAGGAATYGASLMREPKLTGRLVEAVGEAVGRVWGMDCGVEVSVKTRIAAVDTPEDLISSSIDDDQNTPSSTEWTLDEDQYASLNQYVTQIQEGGADHVILHARPAVLSGLSPVKNRIVPKLDYRAVERVANDFPGMRVTLNGGLISFADLKAAMNDYSGGTISDGKKGVASHMAGRWMLRRPCDLSLMSPQCLGSSRKQRQDANMLTANAIQNYINYVDQALGRLGRGDLATPTHAELFLPLYLVVEQLREDYDTLCERMNLDIGELEGHFMVMETIEEIYGIIVEYLKQQAEHDRGGAGKRKKSKIPAADEHNFKKLAASFKGIVGTKVANKWRRNRAEL